jgi:hypothetical protein
LTIPAKDKMEYDQVRHEEMAERPQELLPAHTPLYDCAGSAGSLS